MGCPLCRNLGLILVPRALEEVGDCEFFASAIASLVTLTSLRLLPWWTWYVLLIISFAVLSSQGRENASSLHGTVPFVTESSVCGMILRSQFPGTDCMPSSPTQLRRYYSWSFSVELVLGLSWSGVYCIFHGDQVLGLFSRIVFIRTCSHGSRVRSKKNESLKKVGHSGKPNLFRLPVCSRGLCGCVLIPRHSVNSSTS